MRQYRVNQPVATEHIPAGGQRDRVKMRAALCVLVLQGAHTASDLADTGYRPIHTALGTMHGTMHGTIKPLPWKPASWLADEFELAPPRQAVAPSRLSGRREADWELDDSELGF